jgi:predicted XRE-type DNA-binding protein
VTSRWRAAEQTAVLTAKLRGALIAHTHGCRAGIETLIQHQLSGFLQRRAAKVLGIAPPDMSDLMRGKLARFSQERLERFLNALGMDIHIQVGPRRTGKKHATVTVELVGAF